MPSRALRISPDVALPVDAVTATQIVYGGKGMGKTNLGSVIVEELTKSHLRWSFLDPMGVAWGLRHSADGTGPGIECVLLGGAHGDIPIEPTGGAVVADLVIDENANTIIDFSRKPDGRMWSIGEKVRFVTDYAYRLFQRQGELHRGSRRDPLLQVLDEAARYIPQVIPSGAIDLAKCVAAWEQISEEGRNIGLGVMFLTQRSARINKSVAELADVMYAFRTVGPRSLSAVMDWLGEHVERERIKDLAEQVRKLPIGSALVVSPGWLGVEQVVRIRMRETFDSSATPKAGQRARRVTGKAAKPDLAKYEARMAETIERAKASDPTALRKEVATLRHALQEAEKGKQRASELLHEKSPKTKPTQEQLAKLEAGLRARWARDFAKAIGKDLREVNAKLGRFMSVLAGVDELAADLNSAFGNLQDVLQPKEWATSQVDTPLPEPPPRSPAALGNVPRGRVAAPPPRPPLGDDDGRPAAELALVGAAQQLVTIGVERPTRDVVAVVAGVSPTSSTTEKRFANLTRDGLLTQPGDGTVALTPDGAAAVRGRIDTSPPTLDEYHERWRVILARLGENAPQLFEAALRYGPKSWTMARSELATQAGISPTSSTTERGFAKLTQLGLLAVAGKGLIGPGSLLYPEGLR
jgi:hypothetical protein